MEPVLGLIHALGNYKVKKTSQPGRSEKDVKI